jgi:hypothetical protein
VADISTLFERLEAPSDCPNRNLFATMILPGRPKYRLAKDTVGAPALLIETGDRSTAPEFERRYLSFLPRCDCEIREDSKTLVRTMSVVRCTAVDPELRSYFLSALETLIRRLPRSPKALDVADAVAHLVELFRALAAPPRTTVQGLWAELLVLYESSSIALAADAWHATPRDLFDFRYGNQRLEIKSAAGALRLHHFRLEQLVAPEECEVVVGSVLLVESARGLSVRDLWSKLVKKRGLSNRAKNRLEAIVASSIGSDWRHADSVRFDLGPARASLKFFESSVIPRVDPDLPVGVSCVRFTADLNAAKPLSPAQLKKKGDLFAAVAPR